MENKNTKDNVLKTKKKMKDPDLFAIISTAKIVDNWDNLTTAKKEELAKKLDLSIRTLYRYVSDYDTKNTKVSTKKNPYIFKMIRAAKIVEDWDAYTTGEKEKIALEYGLTPATITRYINEQKKFSDLKKKDPVLFKVITAKRVVNKWSDISGDTKKQLSEDFNVSIRTLYRYISDYQNKTK